MQHVVAYCLEWHLTKSGAFQDMFVDPLAPHLQIELRNADRDRCWDEIPVTTPIVFCQAYPPRELLDDRQRRLVWIPMWDTVQNDGEEFWLSLPTTLRIVAFSGAVADHAEAAGLPTLRLRYFKDPLALGKASWSEGRSVFYWNRTGLVGPRFLERICAAVGARRLFFLDELDSPMPGELYYDLPSRLGSTDIVRIRHGARDDHLAAVETSNVVVAPRASEGVGMTFLEGMARGCAVLAYDAPTMNEYVEHKRTGYLFDRTDRLGGLARAGALVRLGRREPFALSPDRDWSDFAALDLEALGTAARGDHVAGYERWRSSAAAYAAFVSEW